RAGFFDQQPTMNNQRPTTTTRVVPATLRAGPGWTIDRAASRRRGPSLAGNVPACSPSRECGNPRGGPRSACRASSGTNDGLVVGVYGLLNRKRLSDAAYNFWKSNRTANRVGYECVDIFSASFFVIIGTSTQYRALFSNR